MTTDTAALTPAATYYAQRVVHEVGDWVSYSSPGTTVAKRIGTLPAGAMVVGGGAYVTTAFTGSGTDVIDIGTVADPDGYATLLDVSSKGLKVNDELATTDDYTTSEVGVVATYTDQNANAGAGVAYCFVQFIIPRPISGP